MTTLYATQKEGLITERFLNELETEFIGKLTAVLSGRKEPILEYLKLRLDFLRSYARNDGDSVEKIALGNVLIQGRIAELELAIKALTDPEGEIETIKREGI